MNENNADIESLTRLQLAWEARSVVKGWAKGMELVELVRAAHRGGWLERLRRGTTVEDLAAGRGVSVEQATDVVAVLVSAGVAQVHNESLRLSPGFDALVDGHSGVELRTVLEAADLARVQARRAVQPAGHRRSLDGRQALTIARDWGVRASDGSRQMYKLFLDALPEYRSRLEHGGPLLDVGSGVGGGLLTALTLFDELHAVGVEVVPGIASEIARRAKEAGVTDRLTVRAVDARTLDGEQFFTVSFWAHAFFARSARADTLATIFRLLRPDGLLLMQELAPPPTVCGPLATRAHLDQLFGRLADYSFGISAEALVAEANIAGFVDAQIVDSQVGRLVVVRKPFAQRHNAH